MIRVVLARPEGPRNVGSALRAAANFGPAELYVAAPQKASLLFHPDFEQMAHGVEGMAERIVVVDRLEDALADCSWSVAFTARQRGHRVMRDWREARDETAAICRDDTERCALVFGNEAMGLSSEETDLCQDVVKISTSDEHTSLNLAMAVTVVLYSLFESPPLELFTKRGEPLLGRDREYLKLHAAETLKTVARSPSVERDIETSALRVFARAPLETRDARAWHAIFRALGNRRTPMDYGL